MAALLLTNLFGYVVVGGLHLAGISNGYIDSGILAWEFAALAVVLKKIVLRAQADRKNQTSTKK